MNFFLLYPALLVSGKFAAVDVSLRFRDEIPFGRDHFCASCFGLISPVFTITANPASLSWS